MRDRGKTLLKIQKPNINSKIRSQEGDLATLKANYCYL